jgi:hypothetical protein
MDNKGFSRAKEIYFTYASSKFQMMRDGLLHEYSQYDVSRDLEEEWLTELLHKEINKLNINDSESLFPLWYIIEINCKIDYLEKLIEYAEKNRDKARDENHLKAFVQKISETIAKIAVNCQGKPEVLSQLRKRINFLIKD